LSRWISLRIFKCSRQKFCRNRKTFYVQ